MLKVLCCMLCLCLWKCILCADPLSSGVKNLFFYDESLPNKFLYSEPGELNVILTLRNISPKVTNYEIYEIKNYEPRGKVIHYGRWTKNQISTEKRFVSLSFNVTLDSSKSNTIFEVSLEANGVLCNRNLNRKFLQIIYTQVKQSVNGKCDIKLDWNRECYHTGPAASGKTHEHTAIATMPAASEQYGPFQVTPPAVTPSRFEDSGQPFVVFTCTARCYPDEVLVWYQDKKLPVPTVLLVNQTYSPYLTSGTICMHATLNKTLEVADRESDIYCGKRVVSLNGSELTLSIPYNDGVNITSNKIGLTFDRDVKTNTLKVAVEPVGVVYIEPNSAMEFVCSSTLVDGSYLTWYEEDLNSLSKTQLRSKLIRSDTTMTSTLELNVDETYVSKSLYCIQEHYIKYRNKSETYDFRYGEIAKSDPIRFKKMEADNRTRKLMIAGACVVGALLMLLAGLLASRCWRRQTPEEEDYVVPQITYAVLALPETDSKPPDKPDKQNYVEIVGVYKNKSKNK